MPALKRLPPVSFSLCAAPTADDEGSQVSGSEAGGYQSDFKRGRRLRKLARMLNSKPAQKVGTLVSMSLLLAVQLPR